MLNKEQIYDSEIAPLMTKIIAICKANKIAMLASFHLPTDEHPDLECTTALLSKDLNPPEAVVRALQCIRPPSRPAMNITTRNAEGQITKMETIL